MFGRSSPGQTVSGGGLGGRLDTFPTVHSGSLWREGWRFSFSFGLALTFLCQQLLNIYRWSWWTQPTPRHTLLSLAVFLWPLYLDRASIFLRRREIHLGSPSDSTETEPTLKNLTTRPGTDTPRPWVEREPRFGNQSCVHINSCRVQQGNLCN